MTLSLHPEALEDLRRSGLDDAMIAEAGLYTPAPGDLARLLAARLVERVRHVLVFPYDAPSLHGGLWRRDDEFVRTKLFPPVEDGQGHTIRYYQKSGTPPRLYAPARARAALADPRVPLLITEGEKKALKASQEGLACVGLGGLWNWQVAGRPIADLDRIDWFERETTIAPDSDVWIRPDLLHPVFALGKELETRGAKVLVLKLPAGPDGVKVGLDDYLCANALDAFSALPRLALKHTAFSRTHVWWRAWVKRKETEPHDGEGEPSVLELLERGETTRFLHPALDVVDGVLFYGVPVGDKFTIVTSRREGFTPETLPAGLALRHADPGPSTIRHETAAAWLAGRAEGSVAHALDGLAAFLARYVALRDPGAALWLGAWALGTWCYRAFRVFPYLSVRSAERRCGKSRLMRLLCRVAFNASPPTTHPTEAQPYREAARRSGVQAFDEMESLKSGADKERLATLISVLNVGFEQGGAVSRQEKRGERFVEVLYEVYAPRVIAGIAGLKDTLEDRSLTLVMFRRRKDETVGRLGREMEREAEALRDACALACLTRIADILTAYDLAPTILDGHDVDDRAVDLWTPLLALAMVADAEAGGGDRAERILRAARDLSDAREADDEAGQAARLVAALQRIAGGLGRMVTPTDLLEALHERGFAWLKSPRGLAGLLAPLGLVARHVREGGRRGRFYVLDPAALADLATRYNPAADEGPLSHPPEIPPASVDNGENRSWRRGLTPLFEVLTGGAVVCRPSTREQRAVNASTDRCVNTGVWKLRGRRSQARSTLPAGSACGDRHGRSPVRSHFRSVDSGPSVPRKWLRTKGCQRVNAKGRFPEGKATGTQRDLLNPALRALATKLTPVASSARNGSATAPVGDGTAIASVDVAELVAMPLDRFAREGHCLEVRVPWLDVTLWFVPEERDAAAIGRTGTSRGRVWTASELMALMALPDRTPAIVETVARAKLAVDGDIVEVRPAGPWRRDEDPRAA